MSLEPSECLCGLASPKAYSAHLSTLASKEPAQAVVCFSLRAYWLPVLGSCLLSFDENGVDLTETTPGCS